MYREGFALALVLYTERSLLVLQLVPEVHLIDWIVDCVEHQCKLSCELIMMPEGKRKKLFALSVSRKIIGGAINQLKFGSGDGKHIHRHLYMLQLSNEP